MLVLNVDSKTQIAAPVRACTGLKLPKKFEKFKIYIMIEKMYSLTHL